MKLTLKTAKVLERLINGESIPSSLAKGNIIDDLLFENILYSKGKHRKTIELINKEDLHIYLVNQLQIHNLNDFILALENKNSTREEFVKNSTDSKNSKERVFKGFLVNSYDSIISELNNKSFTIHPTIGTFTFIYDFETFKIPKHITVVGVENSKNFRCIQEQKYLFKGINPLFISRYPQNQNKDFIQWMKSIPNNYLHFGDLDISGIGIYLNEYKKHLNDKASFYIPKTINTDIYKGNRERFNNQKINFDINLIKENNILDLINLINLAKKGLDQEFYINSPI